MLITILHRPYVFAFLIAFLVLGRIYWGWRKTFLWLVIGYVVAWASELSSIHNGFPYGLYHYIYENMVGELMVAGVPFWDSLSYPFMIFAGYTTARFILNQPPPCPPLEKGGKSVSPPFEKGGPGGIYAALLGAFLTMLLDVIIDPLTVLGDRWFLGNIYYYPNGGQYFGVPLTNFAGWFLVPLTVILMFQLVIARSVSDEAISRNHSISGDRHVGRSLPSSEAKGPPRDDKSLTHSRTYALTHFLYPLFYLSIALFNIAITMWIGEPLLASIDCLILAPVVGLLIWRVKHET